MNRTKVFISYSHKDEFWKDRLMTHLAVLEFEGLLHVWADTRIEAGEDWYERIQSAMDDSRVAVLLVSPDFIASKFIRNEEVPRLLKLHAENDMLILPLIARPCAWQLVPWLFRIQARPKNGGPLSMGNDNNIDADLASFTYEVASLLNRLTRQPSAAVVAALDALDKTCQPLRTTNQFVDDRAVMSVLALAIEHGVPLYNEGSAVDCTHIYRYAAQRLLEVIHASKTSREPRGFTRSVREAEHLLPPIIPREDAITTENADALAWKLRKAFDQILDAARAAERIRDPRCQ